MVHGIYLDNPKLDCIIIMHGYSRAAIIQAFAIPGPGKKPVFVHDDCNLSCFSLHYEPKETD